MIYNGPDPKEDQEYERMTALCRRETREINKYFRICEKNLEDMLELIEEIRFEMRDNRII
jgi:hypothetical protein